MKHDVMTCAEICEMTKAGYGRVIDKSTLYRWVRSGRFPKPSVNVGFQYKRWPRKQAEAAMKKIMGEA